MDSQLDEIKSKLDIVQVVQSYVPSLKPAGRNYFGLCPFHKEKSPSFSVNPELKIYKCFGCGEGGDVIKFIQKLEGLEFRQALEVAAQKAGVELKDTSSPQTKKWREKQKKALQAHRLAADYYHFLLTKHSAGAEGLAYAINKRKLNNELIENFCLGFAPAGYHNLQTFLVKKGFTEEELVEFGLMAEKNGRRYDKFRSRLMHPIFNTIGEVIGFSGRTLLVDDLAPKYLNSPETLIYKKKDSLYGFYQAKDTIKEHKRAVIVEGNIDVISSAKAGIKFTVCPLGTALTIEQLKIIKRYAGEVIFAFDSDNAGKKALLRSLDLAEQVGLEARALTTGNYKDVDDLVKAEPEAWSKMVDLAMPIPEFVMEVFKKDYDLSDASTKSNYINLVLPFISKLQNQIKVDHYLQRLEQITNTRYEVLLDLVNKQSKLLANIPSVAEPSFPAKQIAQDDAQLQDAEENIAPVTAPISVNLPLAVLVQSLYALSQGNRLAENTEVIRAVYLHRLTEKAHNLLDYALGVSSPSPEHAADFAAHLQAKVQSQMIVSDLEELHFRMLSFVKDQLRSYIDKIKKDEDVNLDEIQTYAIKVKAVDKEIHAARLHRH